MTCSILALATAGDMDVGISHDTVPPSTTAKFKSDGGGGEKKAQINSWGSKTKEISM